MHAFHAEIRAFQKTITSMFETICHNLVRRVRWSLILKDVLEDAMYCCHMVFLKLDGDVRTRGMRTNSSTTVGIAKGILWKNDLFNIITLSIL